MAPGVGVAGAMIGVWLAARTTFVPVTVSVPEYLLLNDASTEVCTAILATVRLSVRATDVVPPSAMALLTPAVITKPPLRLALVETSANVPL